MFRTAATMLWGLSAVKNGCVGASKILHGPSIKGKFPLTPSLHGSVTAAIPPAYVKHGVIKTDVFVGGQ